MPEISERNNVGRAASSGWSVSRAEDAEGRPVRVCALTLPSGLSAAGHERIITALNAAVAASAQGRLSLLSWHEENGTLYTVEPAPTVPSIGEAVAANGPLPISELIAMLHGVVGVLSAMEAAGLWHPWLAPENVYPGASPQLAGQGWPEVFRILTAENIGFHWPEAQYAAPEILSGGAPDGRAEAWSAAALVSFALTGGSPSPTAMPSDLPAVCHAVARGMSPDPSARYSGVRTLVVDLTVEHAIGMSDSADREEVPSGGDVPSWGRDLLRETSARRESGRPLVDTAPEPSAAATSENSPAPAPRHIDPIPAPAAPAGKARKSAPRVESSAPAFDWDAGAPKKSVMPLIIGIMTALFIVAGIAITFLRK